MRTSDAFQTHTNCTSSSEFVQGQQSTTQERLISAAAVGRALGVHGRTIHRWASGGQFARHRVGKQWRYSLKAVRAAFPKVARREKRTTRTVPKSTLVTKRCVGCGQAALYMCGSHALCEECAQHIQEQGGI